eukprot:TRINITY_DN3661_c0_g1_i2.p1 TRINITY_DN3661_c0_g1~~TRINITY_DN3661_c0_g1_i2.p1  ORF type:complete len:692 (+),score=171.99 TRINITY_DN3661_c0_g1_i2:324-2399(+)
MAKKPLKESLVSSRKLLKNVVALVFLEDQINIGILADQAKLVGFKCEEIVGSNIDTYQTLTENASKAINDLSHLITMRSQGKRHPKYKKRLLNDMHLIQTIPSRQWPAVANMINNPSDTSFVMESENSTSDIIKATDDILEVVRLMYEDNMQYLDSLFKLKPPMSLSKEGVLSSLHDINGILSNFNGMDVVDFQNLVGGQLKAAERVAGVLDPNSVSAKLINMKMEDEELLKEEVVTAWLQSNSNPNNKLFRDNFLRRVKKFRNTMRDLADLCTLAEDDLEANSAAKLCKFMSNLKKLQVDPNTSKEDLEELCSTIIDRIQDHILILDDLAEKELNPDQKSKIWEKREKLQNLVEKLVEKPKLLSAEKVQEFIKDILSVTPTELCGAYSNMLSNNLNELLVDIEKNFIPEDINEKTRSIVFDLGKQIEYASIAKVMLVDSERKRKVDDTILQLRGKIRDVVTAIKALENDPANPELKEAVKQHIADLNSLSRKLATETLLTPEDREAQIRQHRSLLKQIQAKDNNAINVVGLPTFSVPDGEYQPEVYQAASELNNKAIDCGANIETPVGQMSAISHDLAVSMAELASFAGKGDASGIIDTAKSIQQYIRQILKQAKVAIGECPNEKMKDSIINFMDATENWGVQLKIIAAVKAASEDSVSAEEQLTKCAQGLSTSIQNCLDAAEMAQLKNK